jgi:hypothetical protein
MDPVISALRRRRTLSRMSTAMLDRLLAVLVIALAVTGVVTLRVGSPDGGWLFALHGILAGALAVTATMKVARSLPKAIGAQRWGRVAMGMVVSIATAAALVGGFAWVSSGRLLSIGSWTVLTIHAWIGLLLVPIVAIHLLPRRWRLLVPRPARAPATDRSHPSRRQVLVGGVLGVTAVSIYAAAGVADTVMGGVRRFTGSRWLPSGGVPPPTTFYGEAPPALDVTAWRLRVTGRVERSVALSLADLRALGERDLAATLDCTSGWAMETTWRGVSVADVLDIARVQRPIRSVVIRSMSGYATALSATDASRAVLATTVAGEPLPVANGAPCRLVAPDHRGLDWIKWVTEIEVV